jgi:hypothetical protein
MLRSFVYVFVVLSVKVGQGVVSYVPDKGVGMCRTTAEEFVSHMVYEISNGYNV